MREGGRELGPRPPTHRCGDVIVSRERRRGRRGDVVVSRGEERERRGDV